VKAVVPLLIRGEQFPLRDVIPRPEDVRRDRADRGCDDRRREDERGGDKPQHDEHGNEIEYRHAVGHRSAGTRDSGDPRVKLRIAVRDHVADEVRKSAQEKSEHGIADPFADHDADGGVGGDVHR